MKKKILISLLSICMGLSLTACEKSEEQDDVYVAVICKGTEHEFWQAAEKGVQEAGRELNIRTTFTAPENESQIDVQIELIEEAIENGADALLVAPLDVDALNNTLRTADEKGISIITFDSDVSYSGRDANIGTENTTAGSIAARQSVKLIGESGEVAIVGHVKDAQTTVERIGGFQQEIAKYPDIKVIDVQYSDGNVEKAKEAALQIINANTSLKLIYATNEGAAVGVCEAVEELGMSGKIKIVGFDSSSAEIKYIENGTLNGMVVQNPYNMGYLGVRYSDKLIKGESVEEKINTGATYVNADNLYNEEIQMLLYPMGTGN